MGSWVVVGVRGEVDISNASELGAALSDEIDSGSSELVADLRDLAFMDSTGLRTLIEADHRLGDDDGRLVIVVKGGPVDRLFDVTGLRRKLDVRAELPDGSAPR